MYSLLAIPYCCKDSDSFILRHTMPSPESITTMAVETVWTKCCTVLEAQCMCCFQRLPIQLARRLNNVNQN